MNFFERQAAARRTTSRLVALFVLAVAGIVLAVEGVLALFVTRHPPVLWWAGGLTLSVIVLASVWRVASLREGGAAIALQLGGEPVGSETGDPSLQRLRHVVEEMAIASGVPVPRIFVLEQESGINALAAGYAPADAVIAVTRGALDRLNRDELQGVIAHEFSHVLYGDMRLNLHLVGLLFGIQVIALAGRRVLEFGYDGRGRRLGALLLVALVAMAIGYTGLFFARLIKAGICRSRERLADASAVQFTRQTAGLAGALKKIAGLPEGSRLADRGQAEEVSHLLFGEGVDWSAIGASLFATHPPLLERIRALEPGFDAERLAAAARRWREVPPQGLAEDRQRGFVSAAALASSASVPDEGDGLPHRTNRYVLAPSEVSAQIGRPREDDYRRADAIVTVLGPELRALAERRDSAMAVVLALLVDERDGYAERQLGAIARDLGEATAEEVRRLHHASARALHPILKLPLASLAFPALRSRPRPELQRFLATVDALIAEDEDISLFEYCLARLLGVQVREMLDPLAHARFGRRRLPQTEREVALLLSVLAQAGHSDEAQARRAYVAGMARVLPASAAPYAVPVSGVHVLDEVWPVLDALDPVAKQLLIEAAVAAVGHDGRVAVAEAELLRTLCALLHCPLPPTFEVAVVPRAA